MIIDMQNARKNRTVLGQLVALVGSTVRLTWAYRVELVLVLVLVAYFSISSTSGPWFWLALTVVSGGLLAWPKTGRPIGEFLIRQLLVSRTRRAIPRAAADSGLPGLRVERVSFTLPGELVDVRVPRGQTVDRLDAAARSIASCLRVPDVRVAHDREDRSHASLSVIRRNVFEEMRAMEWPWLNADVVDVRKPFPFGLDEYGRQVDLRLLSRNLILGGAPDAGKSASLRVVAAAVALDPCAKLWMMDAKTGGAEFVHWSSVAEEVVRGRDLESAVEMLTRLEERIERRGQEIVARGEVFVTPDMDVDVLMIDELPQFTRAFESDDKAAKAAVNAIRQSIWRLIALGRWAGMVTVLSAQKPTADIVPSEFRDLIDLKFALHCNTRQMSDAILGDGSGTEVAVNAKDIPTGQPGVGYLLAGDEPTKMRTFFISHNQTLDVATRAGSRGLDRELEALR